jgi:hypothetical protein
LIAYLPCKTMENASYLALHSAMADSAASRMASSAATKPYAGTRVTATTATMGYHRIDGANDNDAQAALEAA